MPADGIMDTGYKNTISGLLRKRGEMLANKADLRERRSQCCQPLGPPRLGLFNGVSGVGVWLDNG
jgi:hypothetical protein